MRQHRIAEFLGINRNVSVLLGAIILIGTGEEMWMRFLPKYLESLGASVAVIGLFDAIKTLLGAVYAFPGGIASDRWGHRRAFIAFAALTIAGYAIVLLTTSASGVLLGMFLFLAWTNLSLPAMFSLVGAALPADKHAMGIGIQSLIRRLPVLIGPILGGILIDRLGFVSGVHTGVAVSIVLASVALLMQNWLRLPEVGAQQFSLDVVRILRGFSPALRGLLMSDILIRFCERIPFAWVVIYAMNEGGVSAAQVGVLTAIEMAAAIACYIPASYLADRYGREPFVIATFVFFTLFPLVLMGAHGFGMLAFAFAVRGLKEFGEPARKSLIIAHAPVDARGRTIGGYYLVRDTVVTAGSFLGAWLWNLSPVVNFGAAAVLGLAGTVVYAGYAYRRR